jgi:hypothetical protein
MSTKAETLELYYKNTELNRQLQEELQYALVDAQKVESIRTAIDANENETINAIASTTPEITT